MEFLPVILGTDWNAYGVASSFHKAYQIKSVALGMREQIYTRGLDFLELEVFENFTDPEVFVNELLAFSKRHANKLLLLIPCSDYYTQLIISSQDRLKDAYLFNLIDLDLYNTLESKKDFYALCEDLGVSYPKTFIVTKDNYHNLDLPFDFPVIAKPNDSFKWLNVDHFEGYKKAYKVEDMASLVQIMDKAYAHAYDDVFIVQDFIPGDSDQMYVVNAYVDKDGHLRMTHGAQTALDEVLPNDIGNYNALISGDYPNLIAEAKTFLEKINYRGYANLDFKFDERDQKFKLFEINIRQGRSSMYMTYAGNNFVTYLVDDLVYQNNKPHYNHTNEHLWYLVAEQVLKKYTPLSLKDKVSYLLKENKASYGLSYYANKNLKRFITANRRKLSTIKYYPRFAGKSS